jgi:tetratricopeptide (TPR) repeat protein
LETVQARLAWAVRQQVDPAAAAPEAAPTPTLPLRAYESYVRAELAASNAARLNDLDVAFHFAPHDARILLALGEAELGVQHNPEALKALLQVPAASPEYPEAQFNAGLAAFRMRQFPQAESIFSGLEAHWPLPSVMADLALAKAGVAAPNGSAAPAPAALKADFPLESFLQLQRTVASFNAAKLQALAPAERVASELDQGQRLLAQKAWDAAAQNFQRVLNQGSAATAVEAGAAHAGLAAVWMARHNSTEAAAEAAAALNSDPNNAAAQALQAQRGSKHETH